MYHALLTNRYLTSRVIPFVAVAAVALCVALVIIVVSVMTGFLEMVKSSGKTLVGDVVINRPVTGIPYYEDLIAAVEGLDEAAAASPIVESWGLMRMPYPDGTGKDTQTVQVWGIEPDSFSRVTGFADTLYWSPLDEQTLEDAREDDIRRQLGPETLAMLQEDGTTLENSRSDDPAMVMGMHVSIGNDRKSDGSYEPARGGYWHMPRFSVVLTMLPVVEGSLIDPTSGRFQIVNEFISGVFLIDKTRTMIPIAEAQRLLELTEQTTVDDEGEIAGTIPKRATMILVRAAEGVQPEALRDAVEGAYMEFHERVRNDPDAGMRVPHPGAGITIQTWEQQQRDFIAPIEKERELMRTLFSLVYIVCSGLVLAIFWAIVYEKTRDIGILRSIGASRIGISWIFLRYGLVIGILGAVLGLGLGWLVVDRINEIHTALGDPPKWLGIVVLAMAGVALVGTIIRSLSGRLLPLVLGSLLTVGLLGIGSMILVVAHFGGVVIWDPSVYYFTEIPNEVDLGSAAITMVGAIVFSVIGAFLPAAKAADTDPVKALRYE